MFFFDIPQLATHLRSSKTELVWPISTTTPLFGLKLLALFIVCIFLFLILYPFNVANIIVCKKALTFQISYKTENTA